MDAPPTREQLAGSEPFSLDGLEVVKNFLGKTQAEARRMFARRTGFSTEDFMHMAREGLRYYLHPARDYLRSDEAAGNWEFCMGLLCSISFQAEEGELPSDVLQQIREIAGYADAHRARFDVAAGEKVFNRYLERIREA